MFLDSLRLLSVLTEFNVAIPRLVVQEVIRNLDTPSQVRMFYRLLYGAQGVVESSDPGQLSSPVWAQRKPGCGTGRRSLPATTNWRSQRDSFPRDSVRSDGSPTSGRWTL